MTFIDPTVSRSGGPEYAREVNLAASRTSAFVTFPTFTGDTRGVGAYTERRVQVLTPERLDLITRRWRTHLAWLSEVHLAVVDEAYHLGDPSRGARRDGPHTAAHYPAAAAGPGADRHLREPR